MKKERYYYSTDLSISSLEVLTKNKKVVGTSKVITEIKKVPRVTICGILDTDTDTMVFGVARCSSKDSFVKSIGRTYSKQRAEEKPYKTISVKKTDKISDIFIKTAQSIEEEILAKTYPIKL